MVGALLGALVVVVWRYFCAAIAFIASRLASITGVMSTNVVGMKLHSSGWWGSNRKKAGGAIESNALATPAPAAVERARATTS